MPHTQAKFQSTVQKMTQFAIIDDSSFVDEHATKQVQTKSGTFIYYTHAVVSTNLPAINEISNQQAKPTKKTAKVFRKLMDYLNTHTV